MIRGFMGKVPRIAESVFVGETAYIMGDVEIGENSSVWPGAVIRADARSMTIGQNTHIEDNVVVHFTKSIGDNVIMGHGAVVEATSIGNNVLIGDNATVLGGCRIGDFCIIGAGATVMQKTIVPDRSFVVGIPAEIREVSEKQLTILEETLAGFPQLLEAHKKNMDML